MDAQFLDPCDVRIVQDSNGRPIYELLRSFAFYSNVYEREFTVPPGATFDGPSIPQVALWATGAAPGLRASAVHDYLCRTREVPREVADRVFLEALRVCGVESSLASMMYQAVRAYSLSLEPMPPEQVVGSPGSFA